MTAGRRVVLVTGAARGIGRAVAELAARGGDVVVCHAHRNLAAATELAARIGGTAVAADLADPDGVATIFAHIDQHHGRLDGLVNNAATAAGYGPILADGAGYDAAALSAMLAVNVTSVILAIRAAAQRMTDGGSIVNVSSVAATLGGAGEWAHYAASKGAVDTLTRGAARELADRGIRVNAVRPGLVDTDFHEHAPPGRMDRLAPAIPMRRAGRPIEIAEAIVWLLSDAASYVTGAVLDVSGGR